MSIGVVYAPPMIPYSLTGTAYVDDVALTSDDTDYTVSLEIDGVEIASYTMGDNPEMGDDYYLVVPLGIAGDFLSGFASPGDLADIFINGVLVAESPVTIGAEAGWDVLDIHVVFEEVLINIIPQNVEISPGNTGYANVTVSPADVYDLEIKWEVCKDNGTCDSNGGEISVVFSDGSGFNTMTNVAGEASIEISLSSSSVPGTKYIYYVKTNSTDWVSSSVTVGESTMPIPEFPFSFLVPVVVVFYVTRKMHPV